MPSSSIIIPFRNLLSVLILLPLVLSCRQAELILPVPPVSGKGETAEVTLSVRIPDFRAANNRGVDENGITEITVLMFADEGDMSCWRPMFYIGVVPALILLIGMAFMTESQRWLISRGRDEEGKSKKKHKKTQKIRNTSLCPLLRADTNV